MPHAHLIHIRCFLGVLVTVILLCGCERGRAPSIQTHEQPAASSEGGPARDPTAHVDGIEDREKAARIARLSAELTAARALHTELQQQRAAIDARLVAQEQQGMALLDAMKSQVRERARQKRDDPALEADVRAKLEASLAENDALTTSMRDIDARIAETSIAIERLNAEHKTLQEGV